MNDTVKPNIPYKAIQLFDTIDETSTYDRDVFVYSSSGIRRMSFSEYLHTIEAAHSGDYKMVKVWRTALSEIDQAHFDAIKKSTYNGRSGNRLGTIYMCFRALWFAATKELMSTLLFILISVWISGLLSTYTRTKTEELFLTPIITDAKGWDIYTVENGSNKCRQNTE